MKQLKKANAKENNNERTHSLHKEITNGRKKEITQYRNTETYHGITKERTTQRKL